MFNIFDATHECLVLDLFDKAVVFETGPLAAAECKLLHDQYGGKFSPRPAALIDDPRWKRREQTRLQDGTYMRPQFFNEFETSSYHFLHLSAGKPGALAYTKDETKGRADLQATISLRGYFELYNKHALDSVPRFEDKLKAFMARLPAPDSIKFAKTPSEIAEVYTKYNDECHQVRSSCMRYNFEEDNEDADDCPAHPCSVYGAGDLAVAYLTDKEGRTTHRALCWPDRLVYSRVYGDDGSLHVELKKLGYKKSPNYWPDDAHKATQGLEGARLLRVWNDNDSSIFLVPYCDDVSSAKDDGTHLILDNKGRIGLRRTDGWSDETHPGDEDDGYNYTCSNCDNGCDDTYTVYMNETSTRQWCESCRDDGAFYCNQADEYYSDSRVGIVHVNGEVWSEYAARENAEQSDRSELWFHSDDMRNVIIDDSGTVERWGANEAHKLAWLCHKTSDYVSDDVDPVKVDGNDWAPHVAKREKKGTATEQKPRKLKLKGDDPGQFALNLSRARELIGRVTAVQQTQQMLDALGERSEAIQASPPAVWETVTAYGDAYYPAQLPPPPRLRDARGRFSITS